ncbi:MAG: Clp1/GlmU family protein [Candidatus Methylomirabilales bacterium]
METSGLTVAYVDGDPRQSTLSPPTAIGMAIYSSHAGPSGVGLHFVGQTSPQRHVPPLLIGLHRPLPPISVP